MVEQVGNIVYIGRSVNIGEEGHFEGIWFGLLLLKNDLLMVKKVTNDGAEAFECNGLCIYFAPECMAKFSTPQYDLLSMFDTNNTNVNIRGAAVSDIRGLFEEIDEYARSDCKEKDIMVVVLLAKLIVNVNKLLGLGVTLHEEARRTKDNSKINDIINFITQNLHRKITLGELEREFFINKFYLCHLFKDTMRCTVTEYISRRKIEVAKEMLNERHLPSHVCAQLGFDDYSNFYRLFKRVTGVSPSEYKKNKS